MTPNPLRSAWNAGRATLNGWLTIPQVTTAEVMARQGFDSLTIDLQHGLADYRDALGMLAAMAAPAVVPLARVPWLEEGIIMRMLDAGCLGIICPMINDKEEAARFVRACRYAPAGTRSFGPVRAALVHGPDYQRQANTEVLPIAMIETRKALDRLEEILDVEGLGAIYVGPADLSLALGCTPKFDQEEAPVVEAIRHIVTTAKSRGQRVGVHNLTVAYAQRMVALGADFVTVSSDLRFLTAGAEAAVAEFRAGGPRTGPEGSY